MDFTLREIRGADEYFEGLRLQRETWGADFSDKVPPSMMILSQHLGGIAAGAFTPEGRMVGFLFGLTGLEQGRPVHWSHMLAIDAKLRDQGLGRLLKLYQRDRMLKAGIDKIYWTFDPLVARNAHLNLNKLGVRVQDYFEDFYPDMTSVLHQGLGTDRFRVAWDIRDPRVERILGGSPPLVGKAERDAPVVNASVDAAGIPQPIEEALPELPAVRIEVPADIHAAAADGAGQRWRSCTRRAFQWYLSSGYAISGFCRDQDGRCFYIATI